QLNDLDLQNGILLNIGVILIERGDLSEAVDHYKHALGIFDLLDDLKGRDQILPNIGMILSDRGDLSGALDYNNPFLNIAEQLGDLKLQSQISLDTTSVVVHVLLLAFYQI
ncbi:hypothetical protein LCGC14_2141470, partial [marine sediment metagenome]